MKLIIYLKNITKIIFGKVAPRVRGSLSLKNVLAKNYPADRPFSFIQVGAWDGVGYDSLYEFVKAHNTKGVVIEPLPDYFKQLVANYSFNPAIVPVNKAVHPYLKEIELFRVDPDRTQGLPDWAGGIASIDPEHHKKSGIPSAVIIKQRVPSDHLMNIIKENFPGKDADLVQIDTEGFDYQVLQQIDFSYIKPDLVRFEYINLDQATTANAIKLLKQNGYYCFYDDLDIIGVNLMKIRL